MNIFECVRDKNLDMFKKMLIEDPNLIEAVDKNGTPLPFCAALTGDLAMVSYVVEYTKASMNMKDVNGRDILHYAAEAGEVQLIHYLVEKVGMDFLRGDYELVTPFDIAYKRGHGDAVRYFEGLAGCRFDEMYRNPIRRGFYPDPSVVRVGQDYYMVNSSFTYFPCIPVSHSKDLVHWEIVGFAITEREYSGLEGLESGRGYWAPDISFYEGEFYITATYRKNDSDYPCRCQIIVSSERAQGPYSKPAVIEEDGIDPSLFADDDGRRYMLLNRGARIVEINREGTETIGDAELIWYGSNKRAPEGPHLLKKDGFYYLFMAEGGTGLGHQISVARSEFLRGPYEACPFNPIMSQKDSNAVIQRAGHGKPVQTASGDWYMVYLCGRPLEGRYSVLGRETALDPIQWTADGWPIVNCLKGPSVLQRLPVLQPLMELETDSDRTGIFNSGIDFNKEWMWVRIPDMDAYERLEGQCFRLYGGTGGLHDIDGCNVLVRRQTEFKFSLRAEFTYSCLQDGHEAGVTCYYDENTYLTFGIVNQEGKYMLMITEQKGEERHITFSIDAVSEVYQLYIETDGLKRSFYYGTDGIHKEFITTLMVDYLCDEGYDKGKRFTGAMVGIYAVSGLKRNRAYVDFSEFEFI